MFYNFYVTHIRYKNYKLLCGNSIALDYFCATNSPVENKSSKCAMFDEFLLIMIINDHYKIII